jgi:drug/metabolite transporter (DMT)-like permease
MGTGFYLILGLLASILMAMGLLLMKACAYRLPAATGRATLRIVWLWVRDPIWLAGLLLQAAGFALFVLSLAGAPLSLVSVMMQGGIALFVLFAYLGMGERARPWEWTGIAAITIGMILLGLSLSGHEAEGPAQTTSMMVLSTALLLLGLIPYASQRFKGNGVAPATLSGMILGLASVYTKALADNQLAPLTLTRLAGDPYLWATILTNIVGLVLLQNSFVAARGIIAMPLSSALSNIVPIVGGAIVFDERLPRDPMMAALRITAFVVTVVGSAMLAGYGDEPLVEPAETPSIITS